MRRWNGLIAIVVVLQLMGATPAQGNDLHDVRVRGMSPLARRLMADAVQRSPLFRALVDRLDRSDVVVYVDLDMRMPERTRGRLRFIGSAGGRRYLDVRIAHALDRRVEMAMIAHELRHAIEIADAREVVDARSMDRFYRRIGFSLTAASWYESHAAVETGQAVLRELSHPAGAAAEAGAEDGRK